MRAEYGFFGVGSDEPDMIQKCLNCPRPKCVNCLERMQRTREKPYGIPVQQLNKKTGEIIATYSTIIEASAATGVSKRNIRRCVLDQIKTGGGFRWKRV